MNMGGGHGRYQEGSRTQNTLRAFVAVPIPDAVTHFLAQIQARLRSSQINIRWVKNNNIHLTLKFLGDIDPSRIPLIAAQMNAAASLFPSFSLKAKGVGVFPNRRRARVLWVGLTGDCDRLRAIQANLETGLESIGFAREPRDFYAHLTIGRPRQHIDGQAIGAVLESMKTTTSDPFRVDRLKLYESMLKPAGAVYSVLHTARLMTDPVT